MKVAEQAAYRRTLSRPGGGHCAQWDFESPRIPRLEMADPVLRAVNRRERSTRISPQGWRAIIPVLRAR